MEKNKACCTHFPIYGDHTKECVVYADLPDCERCGEKIEHGTPVEYALPGQGTKYTSHQSCVPQLAYVNAYEVTRRCGGQEEGGWWYNIGSPLASIPIAMNSDPRPHKEHLRALLEPLFQHGDIYSMRGGAEVSIVVEDHQAEAWPSERPRYE